MVASSKPHNEPGRTAARWALAVFYAGAGVLHLREPDKLLLITPDWVPHAREVIFSTGVCEILGAAGLTIPRVRKFAGIMLALYAICVFPANIKHALDGIIVPGLPSSWLYHAPRLALQPVLVWLALFAGGAIDWPFRRAPQPNSATTESSVPRQ